jgi:hypothetical protein
MRPASSGRAPVSAGSASTCPPRSRP